MREFFDAILAVIDSTSLTDAEFESIDVDVSAVYDKASYEALLAVLQTRENATYQAFRLKAFYIAKGVSISSKSLNQTAAEDPSTAQTNIFIGGSLE